MPLNALVPIIFTAAACLGGQASPPHDQGWRRWVDIQSATLSARYRTVTTSEHVRTANQVQHNEGVRGRVRLDQAARYTVNFGAFTGSGLTSGWNNTGLGTGGPSGTFSLKQLFVAAAPVRGIEIQYGSIYFVRGEHTEITTYDNDGYLTGLRGSITRPDTLFFDEISATQGYLLPEAPPTVFDRGSHFQRANYWQALVAKRFYEGTSASFDYTRALKRDIVRAAFTIDAGSTRVLNTVRLEAYHRLAAEGEKAATGFALYAERSIAKRASAGAGWADIDERYGGLNADRFNIGRRLFLTAALTLAPELTMQAFYTWAPSPDFRIANRTRFDLVVNYNLLRALERRGILLARPALEM
jgi:hypothetical protein